MNTKKYHIMIGLLLILFGFICTGFSIYIYFKPELKSDLNAELNQKVNECKTLAISSGFNVEEQKTGAIITSMTITAKDQSILNDPMPYIYKSSLLISKCTNMKIKTFCIGEGCIPEYNKDFIIKLDRPNIKK